MPRFNKTNVRMLATGLCLLGLTSGATHAGEAANATTPTLVPASQVGSYAPDLYKGKNVLVRLLPVAGKERDWTGKCVDEDQVSIVLQINNNYFRFFYSEIEYIQTL
jgi:hypothetical protein